MDKIGNIGGEGGRPEKIGEWTKDKATTNFILERDTVELRPWCASTQFDFVCLFQPLSPIAEFTRAKNNNATGLTDSSLQRQFTS